MYLVWPGTMQKILPCVTFYLYNATTNRKNPINKGNSKKILNDKMGYRLRFY